MLSLFRQVVASCVIASFGAGCIVGSASSYDSYEAYEDAITRQQNGTYLAAVSTLVVSVVTLVVVATRRPNVTTVVTERVVEVPTLSPGALSPAPAESVAPAVVESSNSAGFGAVPLLSGWALPDAVRAAEGCDAGNLSDCRNFAQMTIHGLNGQEASPEGGCGLLRRLCGFSDSVSCSIADEQCGAVE